jgi:hypothetical protein
MPIGPDVLLLHLRIVGVIMAVLVVVNVHVPRRYRWREEMAGLSLLNRQIFQAHMVFLVLLLGLFSALLLFYAPYLLESTPLSRAVLSGLTIFWALRMVMQWSFYSSKIWRGDRFNTVMHGVFSATWVYVTAVFAVALLRGL